MSTETAVTPKTTNKVGLEKKDYAGGPSTLCTGCGHDSISAHIMSATFLNGTHPHDIAKMSGIGCSSKTPAYYISKSFGFNSMHGRMAPISTGAKVVNGQIKLIGMSGDGDTASIGLGGFDHLIRRNVEICYLVANNGVYPEAGRAEELRELGVIVGEVPKEDLWREAFELLEVGTLSVGEEQGRCHPERGKGQGDLYCVCDELSAVLTRAQDSECLMGEIGRQENDARGAHECREEDKGADEQVIAQG